MAEKFDGKTADFSSRLIKKITITTMDFQEYVFVRTEHNLLWTMSSTCPTQAHKQDRTVYLCGGEHSPYLPTITACTLFCPGYLKVLVFRGKNEGKVKHIDVKDFKIER